MLSDQAEVKKLRSALQRIADLPLERSPHSKIDPALRARRIAVTALGGNHHLIKHKGRERFENLTHSKTGE